MIRYFALQCKKSCPGLHSCSFSRALPKAGHSLIKSQKVQKNLPCMYIKKLMPFCPTKFCRFYTLEGTLIPSIFKIQLEMLKAQHAIAN